MIRGWTFLIHFRSEVIGQGNEQMLGSVFLVLLSFPGCWYMWYFIISANNPAWNNHRGRHSVCSEQAGRYTVHHGKGCHRVRAARPADLLPQTRLVRTEIPRSAPQTGRTGGKTWDTELLWMFVVELSWFHNLSDISWLGSRRYPISEVQVVSAGFKTTLWRHNVNKFPP